MENSENRQTEIVELVTLFLNEVLSADDVLKRWPKGPALNGAEEFLSHEIGHYAADADIRAKDAAKDPDNTTYKDYQLGKIREWLAKFKAS